MSSNKFKYRVVKIDRVECSAEVCKVSLTLTYDFEKFKGVTTPGNESWIVEQGQCLVRVQRVGKGGCCRNSTVEPANRSIPLHKMTCLLL